LDLDNISFRKLVKIGFEKLAVRPENFSKWAYLGAVQACWEKSKETSGEENPKTLKSGSKDQNDGAGWLER